MDVHTDPLRQAASRSSLGAVALAALVSATVGDGGYLGISSDIHGLYRTPPRALHSLRSDFHFARDHSLSAGDPPLELSAISDFGGSMHLQLDVMRSNSSRFSLELSVLGGASTVSVD